MLEYRDEFECFSLNDALSCLFEWKQWRDADDLVEDDVEDDDGNPTPK